MFTFFKIAWRNIFRNKRRSLITISAVSFGLGALIFIWSFVEGAHKQMIENYTSLVTSHIQIHEKGFHQQPKLELSIQNHNYILTQLEESQLIESYALRVKTMGLLSSAESSSGVMIMGIEPALEKTVSSLWKRLKEGTFFSDRNAKEIIIGASLAKNLNVKIDEKIVVMSQALDGSMAAESFVITGLLDTGTEELDKGIALIPLGSAQELFVMNGVSEIALKIPSVRETQKTAQLIRENLNRPDLEILPWEDISVSFRQWIEFDNGFIWIIIFIIMIVVAIGILNTILMGVLERTREFGILIALGTKGREIVTMVTWESIFLGLTGCVAGLLIGGSLTLYFGKKGIDLSMIAGALNSFYMDSSIFPILETDHLITSLILVLVTSILVSIYPAWHASNLKPIEAIRSIY